jgi:hypothetical protein
MGGEMSEQNVGADDAPQSARALREENERLRAELAALRGAANHGASQAAP